MTAYQTYQENARVNVINGSINQIIKAFNACISVNPAGTCASDNINGTLAAQPNAAVDNVASSTAEECFTVIGATGSSLEGYTGCVAIDGTNGSVTRQSADSDIRNTGSKAECKADGECKN